jgi:nucleotide-binding universal stress UspA family protein
MSFLPKKHVVVPVDFSDRSLAAVRLARTLVEAPSGLHVVHVLPMLSPMDPGVVWGSWTDDSRRKHARAALLGQLGEIANEARITIVIGDPAREIAEIASRDGAELIVIPSHGRTGPSRVLIGSVAERVVRHAHCPVLVLRE